MRTEKEIRVRLKMWQDHLKRYTPYIVTRYKNEEFDHITQRGYVEAFKWVLAESEEE